jgi:PAS domain S-box-containing protein
MPNAVTPAEHFRALIENSRELVAIIDLDGAFRYASPSYEKVLGYCPRDLEGTSAMALVHPDDVDACGAVFAAAIDRPGELVSITCRLRDSRGATRIVEMTGQNLTEHPAIQGIVCNGRDVTARETAKAERQALEQQLGRSQRLEAVGKLAGGVAHDFNNLLTVIRANVEFALQVLTPDMAAHADLQAAMAAADRASALTRQLLAFSSRQAVEPQPLDLNVVITDLKRLLERLITDDIVVDTRLASDLGKIFADRSQVEQVVMNLAVNARDAMPTGGTLTITTSNIVLAAHAPMPAGLTPGPYVLLTVADTGHGMDRETLERVFEPFFTTKSPGSGTGLGLSTVYGIARQSGGHVAVDSTPGKGSVFTLYFPRHVAAEQPQRDGSTTETGRAGGRILLVDDEPGVRRIARRILERLGYEVVEAGGARDAIAAIDDAESDLQLVITDSVMAEMSGRELVDVLRRERPWLRAIIMSGYSDDDAGQPRLDTATRFLEKPFTGSALGTAVRELLELLPS